MKKLALMLSLLGVFAFATGCAEGEQPANIDEQPGEGVEQDEGLGDE